MDKGLRLTQVVIGLLCVSLVLSVFMLGLIGGGAPADQPPPTIAPTSQPPRAVQPGARIPGVPARKPASLEQFPLDGATSPERQLDYKAEGTSSVEFAQGKADLEAYAQQPVQWKPCDDALCAVVLAPLDWERPSEDAVELALLKVPGKDAGRGSLLVNPGGPGAGGTEFAASLKPDDFAGYDIVGWDPRGTGKSTHVVCGSTAETDKLFDLDQSPDDATEDKALRDGYKAFAKQCRDASGKLLDHISSVDVARDMDLIRHLLGEDKLNFFGVSYGTYIGAMYATLFPDTSGRMILDGAVEITDAEPVPQATGFERAFSKWADWCAGQEACALHGKSSSELRKQVSDWLQSLDQSPLQVGPRKLTQSHAATGIALFLYADDRAYRTLAVVLQEAMGGNGANLLQAADQLNGRGGNGYDTLAFAFPAMGCADALDKGPDEVGNEWRKLTPKVPVLGRHMGISYACEYWTAKGLPPYKLDAKGADPILVVGSTGDSATPYEQAERMAKQLQPGHLLTFDGPGHGAVTNGNECVVRAVGEFLAEGKLPPDGQRCK